MEDILAYLQKKAKLIDNAIKKYIPKKMESSFAEWAFGRASFSYDLDAMNQSISRPIWDLLGRGGKRWRPALFLLITEALGGNTEKVIDFSIVPELAHNGSLMVDDVEDRGEIRRGKPCIHKIFGTDVAINAGNFMYFIPFLVFIKNRKNFDPKTLLKAYEAFSQEMINIHIGQGMDIWWHNGKDDVTEEQYCQMCAYKTGTLARLSARLAAILSGGSSEQEQRLGKMAEAIGVAFQIQDDILSASGDKFAEKKGFGDDITEGKRTLLVIHTLRNAPQEDRSRLIEILNMHTRDRGLIREALDMLEKHGSIDHAKEFAKNLVQKAWSDVDPVLPASPAKEKIKDFAEFLINREI